MPTRSSRNSINRQQARAICVLRASNEYQPKHVQWLAKQVPNLICLSDVEIQGVETIKLRRDYPHWWAKMELFSDVIDGDLLYFDLDTVILGDVQSLHVGETTVLRDFYHSTKMGSGFMYIKQEDKSNIWEAFNKNPTLHMMQCKTRDRWGDQGFLQDFIGKAQKWQDVVDGIYSYKVHCQKTLPHDAKVICFHGKPRPWEAKANWIPRLE